MKMSAKNRDEHNRFRNITVGFRVSPEENEQINIAVALSGLAKQEYCYRRCLNREIVVQGNPRVYKALRTQLAAVLDELKRIEDIAKKMSLEDILGCISLLQESSDKLAKSTSKRIALEMCIIRLCTSSFGKAAPAAVSQSGMPDGELLKRLARLEDAVRSGAVADIPKQEAEAPPKPEPDPDFKKMDPSQIQPINNWEGLVDEISRRNPAISGFLRKSKAFLGGSTVFIIVDNDFFFQQFKKLNAHLLIQEVLKENFGQTFNIKAKSAKNVSPEDKENPINRLLEKAKKLDIEVDIKKSN